MKRGEELEAREDYHSWIALDAGAGGGIGFPITSAAIPLGGAAEICATQGRVQLTIVKPCCLRKELLAGGRPKIVLLCHNKPDSKWRLT